MKQIIDAVYGDYHTLPSLRPLAQHPPVMPRYVDKPAAVLVGEAPGRDEVSLGEPFVGRAGQRLSTILGDFRARCWVTNIVKYRPTTPAGRDRVPAFPEIRDSMPYFWRELSLFAAPHTRAICAMGKTAASALLQSDIKVGQAHGHWALKPVADPGGELWFVYVTYHPAAALHNPDLKDQLELDLAAFAAEVGMFGDKLRTYAAG